jgi:hypothetical protein
MAHRHISPPPYLLKTRYSRMSSLRMRFSLEMSGRATPVRSSSAFDTKA